MTLYNKISELHGQLPWGTVLDAGTGKASMRWLLSQNTEQWTAVTGSPKMAEAARAVVAGKLRSDDRIVVGNWIDPDLLAGEVFDTVLADYLLGAIEGFAPYWQDQLFSRLKPLVGKRLYIIGLEPYVPFITDDTSGRIIVEIGRLRDACLLLGNNRPYREYPMDWVLRQLEHSGYNIVDAQRIPIRYGDRFINSQLDLCTEVLNKIRDRNVAVTLQQYTASLRQQALALCAIQGGLEYGHDYIVVAEPAASF
jgi:hypothetical protein